MMQAYYDKKCFHIMYLKTFIYYWKKLEFQIREAVGTL